MKPGRISRPQQRRLLKLTTASAVVDGSNLAWHDSTARVDGSAYAPRHVLGADLIINAGYARFEHVADTADVLNTTRSPPPSLDWPAASAKCFSLPTNPPRGSERGLLFRNSRTTDCAAPP